MDRVYKCQEKPFEQLRSAGIAIREIDPQQRHLGLLYWDAALKQVLFLHLAWHFDLRCESPRQDYLWIDPALPKRRLVQLAAICRLVWRATKEFLTGSDHPVKVSTPAPANTSLGR